MTVVSVAWDGALALAHGGLREGGLARLPEAIAIAGRTLRVVRQNLVWAAGYNLLALPAAMLV